MSCNISKRSPFHKTASPFCRHPGRHKGCQANKRGYALSISFMSLIILRLQSSECAPRADLISFQERHSSRGEICQGSRFEKLFRHDLSCGVAASFKEGHRQSRNICNARFAGKTQPLDLSFLLFFVCSRLKEETARRARRLSHFQTDSRKKEELGARSKLDTSRLPRVSGRRAEN